MSTIKVKCKICGKQIERDSAYKISKLGKNGKNINSYYCTQTEYNEYKNNVDSKDKVYMLINDIFGYKITNTAIYKEINEIAKSQSYEKIFKYINDKKDYLSNTINGKTFSSEYGKIRYFSTIIKNSITDWVEVNDKPEVKIETEIVEFKHKYKQKKKRRSMTEIEEDIDG